MKRKILENLVKALITVVIWNIIDFITGYNITVLENIIAIIVFFVISVILDYFNGKKK